MHILTNVLDTFTSLYNTLSFPGCMDIIVVKDHKGTLRSTKFYVCFDQSYFNSSVYLIVNGVVSEIVMMVDEMGNCYFEVDEECADRNVGGGCVDSGFVSMNKNLSKMEKTINYSNVSINSMKNGVDCGAGGGNVANIADCGAESDKDRNAIGCMDQDIKKKNVERNGTTAKILNGRNETVAINDAYKDNAISAHKKEKMRVDDNDALQNGLEEDHSGNTSLTLDLKIEDEEKCIMTDSEDDLRLLRRRNANPHFLSHNFKLSSSQLIVNKFSKESEIVRSTNLIYRTYAMRYFRNRETFYERGGDLLGEFLRGKEHYDYLEESAERLFLIMARRLGTDKCASTDHAVDAGTLDVDARINGLSDKRSAFHAKHDKDGDIKSTKECSCSRGSASRVLTYHSPYLPYGRKTGVGRTTGPFKFTVKYSLCADKKTALSIEKIFADHIVKNYVHSPNLVVRLSDGHASFYMRSDLFIELFMFCLDEKASFTKFREFMREKMGRKNVHKKRTLNLSSHDLHKLHLQYGRNTLEYKLAGMDKRIEVCMYLWNENDKIIVSDIDGTITKSDVWGHIYDLVGKDWTHGGVAALFTKIISNNYRIMYLSNRAMPMYFRTRRYLGKIKQNECTLPDGPIVLSPKSVLSSLYIEVRNQSHIFKIDCLQQIEQLFYGRKPFFAGFGNRISDLLSYKVLGIAKSMIFIIDRDGSICEGMKRKISASYLTLNHFANTIFPEIRKEEDKRKKLYHDFHFWRL